MDKITQVHQLKGFVDSLRLSDNVSKAQLDMLYSKLDILLKTLDDDVWDDVSRIVDETKIKATIVKFKEEEHDDLPF